MFRFETLDIWKDAISYVGKIYGLADTFPKKVQYSLGSQIRSSALSVSNNIAEGSGSLSKLEFKSFLNYAVRSVHETVSILFVAKNQGYMASDAFQKLYVDSETLVKRIKAFRAVL